MNKKLLALLDQINAQKQTVIDLANAGKLEEAKAAKKELQDLQDKFDLLKDIEDPDPGPVEMTAAEMSREEGNRQTRADLRTSM